MKPARSIPISLLLAALVTPLSVAASVSTGQLSEPITLLTYADAEWYGSTFWTGPDWTRVGLDWHHPGENTPSVRRFTAPRDGRVTVTGRVFKLHLDGDGVRASIRHNEREVWQTEIDGADAKGAETKLTLDVKRGDALRFIVDKRHVIACDTTGWDPDQALDQAGYAYQTIRSTTCVQPGEPTSCIGCHEHPMSAPPPTLGVPLAMRRPPSRLDPGELGGRPLSFVEVVQPVLDQHCVKCHSGSDAKKGVVLTGEPANGFTRSYLALTADPPSKQPKQPTAAPLVPRFAQRNQIQTTPAGGQHGALGSRLMKMLRAGHEEVKLSDADLRRLAAWIDCNAVFHGSYDPAAQARHLAGERLPMPEIQ